MKFSVRSQKEFLAGLIFTALGLTWGISSLGYPLGTATSMGPGYFPLAISIVLTGLGIGSLSRSLTFADPEPLDPWNILPLVFVLAGVALFSLLVERTGLALATVGLVVVSSYKGMIDRPVEVALLAVFTTVLVAAIFIFGLQIGLTLF